MRDLLVLPPRTGEIGSTPFGGLVAELIPESSKKN